MNTTLHENFTDVHKTLINWLKFYPMVSVTKYWFLLVAKNYGTQHRKWSEKWRKKNKQKVKWQEKGLTKKLGYVCKYHTVEILEIYSHRKKNSSNQLLSNFFSKIVPLTRFLPKKEWD